MSPARDDAAPAGEAAVPATGEHAAVPRGPIARLLHHDALVVAGALALLAAGFVLHRSLTRPRMVAVRAASLRLRVPASFSLREPPLLPPAPPMIFSLRDPTDARARIDVRVEERRMQLGGLAAGLELERARAHGEFYDRKDSGLASVGARDWLRTRFTYAVPGAGKQPLPVTGIEYAFPSDPAVNAAHQIVVTVHGPEDRARELERLVLTTLTVE